MWYSEFMELRDSNQAINKARMNISVRDIALLVSVITSGPLFLRGYYEIARKEKKVSILAGGNCGNFATLIPTRGFWRGRRAAMTEKIDRLIELHAKTNRTPDERDELDEILDFYLKDMRNENKGDENETV